VVPNFVKPNLPWLISQVRVKTYVKNCLVLIFICSLKRTSTTYNQGRRQKNFKGGGGIKDSHQGNAASRAPCKNWRSFLGKTPIFGKILTFSGNFRQFSCEKTLYPYPHLALITPAS